MARVKRSIEATVTIDGHVLVWHLHREQQWTDEDELRGIGIHVRVAEGTLRKLHMEYPGIRSQRTGLLRGDPGKPTIAAAKVAAHIREAIAAGWDPGSRGKPFLYHVEEFPC